LKVKLKFFQVMAIAVIMSKIGLGSHLFVKVPRLG